MFMNYRQTGLRVILFVNELIIKSDYYDARRRQKKTNNYIEKWVGNKSFIINFMKVTSREKYFKKDNSVIYDMALKNCHVKGLHGIVFAKNEDLLQRMFITTEDHVLWQNQCKGTAPEWMNLSLGVHPHRVDIQIQVITGTIWNMEFQKEPVQQGKQTTMRPFAWNSHILKTQKAGGFEQIQEKTVFLKNRRKMGPGDKVYMKSDQLHTVYSEKGKEASWFITESKPTNPYDGITYANHNLEDWTAKGLYQKPTNEEVQKYLSIANIVLQ